MITIDIKRTITAFCVGCGFAAALASCSGMLDTDSELVEFQEDNTLQQPTDSVYSVMGIVYKMQAVADRTVLLGELRSDLTTTTDAASTDLKAITAFNIDTRNAYNRISDYYAIINNCNYFLANVNKDLVKHDRKVFESEYAAVKAYRAWTYLQLAQIYGSVPLVMEPLLTEEAAQKAMEQTPADINTICNTFIDDIKPYIDTKLPVYGINDYSQKYFIPVRLILADLCLWAGRYQEAAQYYHDHLAMRTAPIRTGQSRASWLDVATKEFRVATNNFNFDAGSNECLSFIPMEESEFYGIKSELNNIFNSTSVNYQYAQVKPTQRLRQLSAEPMYCWVNVNIDQSLDTIYAPKENLEKSEYIGDLRFGTVYENNVFARERFSRVSNESQHIDKFNSSGVTIYRTNMVYLRYAEALNRAGFPQSAFAVLKYGLNSENVGRYIDSTEVAKAGELIAFDEDLFVQENTLGVHSRGCGLAPVDTLYVIPQPLTALPTRQDTIDYQIPLVEDIIIKEMALEGAFEGYRFYDLMRVALRRSDPAYLADPISRRSGQQDETLRSMLMDTKNWYLPRM